MDTFPAIQFDETTCESLRDESTFCKIISLYLLVPYVIKKIIQPLTLGEATCCVIILLRNNNRITTRKNALTEGPTLPCGPASPGRPVRPCQRRRTETQTKSR